MALAEVTHEPICCVVNAELGRNIKVAISEAPLRVPAMISPNQTNGSLGACAATRARQESRACPTVHPVTPGAHPGSRPVLLVEKSGAVPGLRLSAPSEEASTTSAWMPRSSPQREHVAGQVRQRLRTFSFLSRIRGLHGCRGPSRQQLHCECCLRRMC